jgi:hypothetical protein
MVGGFFELFWKVATCSQISIKIFTSPIRRFISEIATGKDWCTSLIGSVGCWIIQPAFVCVAA